MSASDADDVPDAADADGNIQKARETLRVSRAVATVMTGVRQLEGALRSYPPKHPAVRDAAAKTEGILAQFLHEHPELEVGVAPKGFEYQTVPLYEANTALAGLAALFLERGIGRVRFVPGVTGDELVGLLQLALQASEATIAELQAKLAAADVTHIAIGATGTDDAEERMRRIRETRAQVAKDKGRRLAPPRWMYAALVETAREAAAQAALVGRFDARDLHTLAQDVAQVLGEDPGALLPCALARRVAPYADVHRVNPAVLALTAIAPLLDDPELLAELTESALLAGIVQGSPDPIRLLGQVDGISPMAQVVAFELGLGHDFAGSPPQPNRWRQNLFSGLVSAASAYDALTTAGSPIACVLHGVALGELRARAGVSLDRAAVDVLVAALGPIPRGALVHLRDGRFAVVLEAVPSGAPLDRAVRLLTDARGRLLDAFVTGEGTVAAVLDANRFAISTLTVL